MPRRSLTALAVVIALSVSGLPVASTAEAETRCLDRAACRETDGEIAKLKPTLRAAKQRLGKARRTLETLEPGSERWRAERRQLREHKRAFKSLKRELGALRRDYRHLACSSC